MLNFRLKNRQKNRYMYTRMDNGTETRTFTTTESRTIARNEWVLAINKRFKKFF
ncbi:hypothetical protein [Prevotella conceptionensis]|uniref:hypothetical protein n=1 Tax=Prevotella conceptionensis TaxID=340486 RepID=UPI0018DDF8D9|nr:hypothetical protein [Prevotella conceptionensis]